jgi:hypothetical protein
MCMCSPSMTSRTCSPAWLLVIGDPAVTGPEAVACPRCAGSGEGPVDGEPCAGCGGRGVIDVADLVDDRTHDDEAFDRWREEGVAA